MGNANGQDELYSPSRKDGVERANEHIFHTTPQEELKRLVNPMKQKKVSNTIRAAWAGAALETFKVVSNCKEDNQTTLSDLLTDLMHLCNKQKGKLPFEDALQRARSNYVDELPCVPPDYE